MKGRCISKELNKNGNLNITIEVSNIDSKQYAESLELDLEYSIEFKRHRKGRSLSANAYCWELCQQLADATCETKEFVYKKNIRDVGFFTIMPIPLEHISFVVSEWNSRGIGYICEYFGKSVNDNELEYIFYYGSSSYDVSKMNLFIKGLEQDCHEYNIPTLEDYKAEKILKEWEKIYTKNTNHVSYLP